MAAHAAPSVVQGAIPGAVRVRLPDGRRLAAAGLGPPGGRPVLYLHGLIGTPLGRCPELDGVLAATGVRLWLVQRPGFGRSDPAPGRTLTDWPADVAALADALALGRFAVLGVSAGGPYAAACARAFGPRLTATAIVSGTTPLWGDGADARLTRGERWLVRAVRRPRACAALAGPAVAAARRHPGAWLTLAARGAGQADRAALAAGQREAMRAGLRAATADGVGAMLEDARLALGPWAFAPEEVTGQVTWLHGADDAYVPVAGAAAVAARLPGCRFTALPGEGHFFLRRRMAQVLAALGASADDRAPGPGTLRTSA